MTSEPAWVRRRPAVVTGDPRSSRRRLGRPWGAGLAVVASPAKALLALWSRPVWRGLANVPAEGGVIIAANHVSLADPLTTADLVMFGLGRRPQFLVTAGAFRAPVVGWALRATRQIPLEPGADGSAGLDAAARVLAGGGCVVVYPEGEITKDPDGWPMAGRTGVARLAMATGAPVHPLGQWGANRILGSPRALRSRPHLRSPVACSLGGPVDLGTYAGRSPSAAVYRDATRDIMAAVTARVAEVRGEPAPSGLPLSGHEP